MKKQYDTPDIHILWFDNITADDPAASADASSPFTDTPPLFDDENAGNAATSSFSIFSVNDIQIQ